MRVTEDMTTQSGEAMLRLADFIDDEGAGIRATAGIAGKVRVRVDSTKYPSEYVDLDPDDADALADLIRQRAAETRASS
jgi:hypothetical protein